MQIAISQKVKNEIKDYFYITLGLLIYTFGWTIFLLPYQIVTGGVTGIAAVIFYGTGIPIYLSYFLINAALLLAALKILGFKFMVKTIYAIIMLSVFLALAQDWMIGEDGKMVQVLGEGQDFMSLQAFLIIMKMRQTPTTPSWLSTMKTEQTRKKSVCL